MIDVTLANFEAEVVAASSSTPVLIDFWAPWCGPCKTIGPLLEKLEADYGGRFKLAKINADDEQQLAAAFGVRSLPSCILMLNGQPVDGFMGAVPESQIKAFLDQHVPPAQEQAQDALHAPDQAQQADTPQTRVLALAAALENAPDDDGVRFDYIQALWLSGDIAAARACFDAVAAKASVVRRFEGVKLLLNAIDSIANGADLIRAKAQFDLKINANKRDFSARYAYAQALIAAGQWMAAMDELLEILMRDKLWDKEGGQEGKARKLYVAVLDLLDLPKPKMEQGQIPPEDAAVASYRRRLSSVILS